MDVLITDVTEMNGNNYCVAGWNATNKRMVRPLPGGGHWPQALIAKYGIQPGTVLKANPLGEPTGALPHLTEDTPIDPTSISTIQGSPDWLGAGAPGVSTSISEAFNNSLKWNKVFGGVHQGVYVLKGTQCSSLAAVNVGKARISFVQPFGKLLGILDDGKAKYQLSVSSHIYKRAWREGGVAKATAMLPNRSTFHVRVGLARDFEGQPNRCYLMINGIL
ncbi:MAG: hypothetical protein QOF07_154 [Bradyrhizobium sp.]|nr:hypothetical protein [Bradyrhizobium sp.]